MLSRLNKRFACYRQRSQSRQAGFTLIEIMIVLAILGLLFSLVGVKLMSQFKKAKGDTAKLQIANYQQALQAYYLAHSMYPSSEQGLNALIKAPKVGRIPENYPEDGYFGNSQLVKDPWGHPYHYSCDDYQHYKISSDGPDGKENTEDDITAEE